LAHAGWKKNTELESDVDETGSDATPPPKKAKKTPNPAVKEKVNVSDWTHRANPKIVNVLKYHHDLLLYTYIQILFSGFAYFNCPSVIHLVAKRQSARHKDQQCRDDKEKYRYKIESCDAGRATGFCQKNPFEFVTCAEYNCRIQ
jgi:hypothetical protein